MSVYIPAPSALHVPVTVSCPPDMGALTHPKPVKSNSPLNVKHDDVSFQVPVTSPLPQSVVLGQLAAPPVAEVLLLPAAGPLPPVGFWPPVEEPPPAAAEEPPTDELPAADELPPAADVLLAL